MKIACITFHYTHKNTMLSAKAIGADVYRVTKKHGSKITGIFRSFWLSLRIKKYDIYLVDAAWALFVPFFRRLIFRDKIKVIYRSNNPFFNDSWFMKGRSYFERIVIKFLRKQVDGIIAVSSITAKDAKKHKKPYSIAYSMLDNVEKFLNIKPKLTTNNFITIGYPPYKAFDVTISVFQEIRKKIPDAKLYYLGKFSRKEIEKFYGNLDMSNVVICGYVDDVRKYFKKVTYFIEFPNYEPGPTAVLEAMAAGIICFCNENLGHRDFLEKVSKKLIMRTNDPKHIAKNIIKLMNDDKEKLTISRKSKNLAKTFNKDYRMKMFKKAFFDVEKKISYR